MAREKKQPIMYSREEIKGPATFAVAMGIVLVVCSLLLIAVGLIELFSGNGVRYLVFAFGGGALLTGLFAFYLARKLYQRSQPDEEMVKEFKETLKDKAK
jgi:peptidoglycan biosynthesis protein MviN/MurJ (putative lipid II flippase)